MESAQPELDENKLPLDVSTLAGESSGDGATTQFNVSYQDNKFSFLGETVTVDVAASAIQNGTIEIKLPPFTTLANQPPDGENYTVTTKSLSLTKEDLMAKEIPSDILDEMFEMAQNYRLNRTVITIKLQNVSSTVSATFNIASSDGNIDKLSKLMIVAGAYADKIPLNLEAELYNQDGEVLATQIIENRSKIENSSEINTDFWALSKNSTFIGKEDFQGSLRFDQFNKMLFKSNIKVEKNHYPITDIAFYIPVDEAGAITGIYLQDNMYDTGKVVEVDGHKYVMVDEYDWDRIDKAQTCYQMDSNRRDTLAELILDSDKIEPGRELEFDPGVKPYLQYTYLGECERIYAETTLPNYHFKDDPATVDLRLGAGTGSEDVKLAEEPATFDVGLRNYYAENGDDHVPVDRYGLRVQLEMPRQVYVTGIEVEPSLVESIQYTTFANSEAKTLLVNAETGDNYSFNLQDDEYIKSLTIVYRSDVPVKKYKWDECKLQYIPKAIQEDGDPAGSDLYVQVSGKVTLDGIELDNDTRQVLIQSRKDTAFADDTVSGKMYLNDEQGYEYRRSGGQMNIRTNSTQKYGVVYKNARFTLDAPPQVTSKIVGLKYSVDPNNNQKYEGGKLIYTTNRHSQEQTISLESNGDGRLPLQPGEYVTSIAVAFDSLQLNYVGKYTMSAREMKLELWLNRDRSYYEVDGIKRTLDEEETFAYTYKFECDDPKMGTKLKKTLSEKKVKVTYFPYAEIQLEQTKSPAGNYTITDAGSGTGYRGNTASVTINFPVQTKLPDYFINTSSSYDLNGDRLAIGYGRVSRTMYVEVLPGYEIKNSSTIQVQEKSILSNGHTLFKVLTQNSSVSSINFRLYIRPDAAMGSGVSPVVAAGLSFDNYFNTFFKDESQIEQAKKQWPYQIVTYNGNTNKTTKPATWGEHSSQEKQIFYAEFSKPEKTFNVLNMKTTEIIGFEMVNGGYSKNFNEANKEKLGAQIFVMAPSNTTVEKYTLKINLPTKGEVIEGKNNENYTPDYDIDLRDAIGVYKGNDLQDQGVTIQYLNKEGGVVSPDNQASWNTVNSVKITFNQIGANDVYRVELSLRTPDYRRKETERWNSYIGISTINDDVISYLKPLNFVYESYQIKTCFAVDKTETGNSSLSSFPQGMATIEIYAGDRILYSGDTQSNSEQTIYVNGYINEKEEYCYPDKIVFKIDDSIVKQYYPTKAGTVSDVKETNWDEEKSGWVLTLNQSDLENSSTSGKYDALFVHLPTIDAKDLTVMVDETKNLDYKVTQTANPDMVAKYAVSATLNNGASSEVIATLDGTTVTGKMEGTVEYQITVTNKQGKTVSDNAMIKVVPRSGVLQIQKEVEPATASGQFSFRIESEGSPKQVWYMHVQGAGFATLDGKTNELILPAGQYTITELDGLNFDLNQTTAKINDLDQGNKRAVTVWITGAEKTRVCFANKVTSSNIPNDSSAVVNGMKQAVITDDYTLYFEQKKELGEDTPSNTTSN